MSLRVRLVLVIVALVFAVAAALSILHLDSLANALSVAALERSENASQQVQSFVTEHIRLHWDEYDAPSDFAGTVQLWDQIVITDPDIADTLVKTMALTPGIVEINVAGQGGVILASSNPLRVGRKRVGQAVQMQNGERGRHGGDQRDDHQYQANSQRHGKPYAALPAPCAPYSFNLLNSVFWLMPRISAARVLLCRVCSSVSSISARSACSMV